jgi:acyl-CoA hydrolase
LSGIVAVGKAVMASPQSVDFCNSARVDEKRTELPPVKTRDNCSDTGKNSSCSVNVNVLTENNSDNT